jgi:hypothetical protein
MRFVFALSLAAAFVPALGVEAQACRAVDATANYFVTDLRELTSSTKVEDGYQRRDLKIPVVDSTTVALVTDERICQKALATLNTTIPAGWPQATRVYVVKVGTVYVALDPDRPNPDGELYAVMKSNNYQLLAKYAR